MSYSTLTLIAGSFGLLCFIISFSWAWYGFKVTKRTDLNVIRISTVWFAVTVLGFGLYVFGDSLK